MDELYSTADVTEETQYQDSYRKKYCFLQVPVSSVLDFFQHFFVMLHCVTKSAGVIKQAW
jgi:hypothetical protein